MSARSRYWCTLLCVLWLAACGEDANQASFIDEPDDENNAADAVDEPDTDPEPDVPDVPEPEEDIIDEPDEPVDTVILPLGETLFLDGDGYLARWQVDVNEPVAVVERPDGGAAEINGERWTPDVPGRWILERDGQRLEVDVRADYLNEDTFLNFNYTPASPLALTAEDELWVASPPSNAVHRLTLGPDGAQAQELVPVGSWPTAVVHWPAEGVLLVSQTGRDSLGWLDLETRKLTDAIHVGDEPTGLVLDTTDPERPLAYVALSGQNAVARVDLNARQVIDTVDVGREPRAMAFDPTNKRLFVASLLSSNQTPLGPPQADNPVDPELDRDVAVIDTATFEVSDWIHRAGTILRGLWLDKDDPSKLVVAASHSVNTMVGVAANSRPHHHGLTIVDIDPESETRYQIAQEINLDELASAASPFSMAMSPDQSTFMVTLSAGRGVLLLDPETYQERGRLGTGHDPRGLVFAQDRMWTYTWLDNAVQSWSVPVDNVLGQEPISVEVGDDPTPSEVKEGQKMFNDAAFSRNNDFSCNNCHIDGLTDGLVWNILLDGDVNTLAFRNVSGSGPFLWGGFLPTLFDFSREVLRLVGAEATGEQMNRLTLYMQSVTAPPNPYTQPGGKYTEAALRGQELFFASVGEGGAGCGGCHPGPLFTNLQQVEGKTEGLMTDVPSLIGVYDTGPWGRQGQWATLREMIDFAIDFTGASALDEQARADVTRFVQEIPGDQLYLNSTSPLQNSEHVHFETPIAITFSSVLLEGQEDRFVMLGEGEDGRMATVPGQWFVKGRNARFEPESPLNLETVYRVRIKAGLSSILGQSLPEEIEYDFTTGQLPEVDVSGRWRLTLSALGRTESVEASFIQAPGGRVGGTILERAGDFDLDHANGYVSGTTFFLDPITIITPIGDVPVDSGFMELERGDVENYAIFGEGTLFSVVEAQVSATRLAYPAGVEGELETDTEDP